MEFLYLIFYACLRLRFLDVKINPGPRRPVPTVCRLLCSNVWDLAGNLSYLTVASSRCDILLCSEFRVRSVRQNLYMFTLNRNADLDDRIFDCLLTSIAALQAEEVRASLLFVGD